MEEAMESARGKYHIERSAVSSQEHTNPQRMARRTGVMDLHAGGGTGEFAHHRGRNIATSHSALDKEPHGSGVVFLALMRFDMVR